MSNKWDENYPNIGWTEGADSTRKQIMSPNDSPQLEGHLNASANLGKFVWLSSFLHSLRLIAPLHIRETLFYASRGSKRWYLVRYAWDKKLGFIKINFVKEIQSTQKKTPRWTNNILTIVSTTVGVIGIIVTLLALGRGI